jgi:hypothetical protein
MWPMAQLTCGEHGVIFIVEYSPRSLVVVLHDVDLENKLLAVKLEKVQNKCMLNLRAYSENI